MIEQRDEAKRSSLRELAARYDALYEGSGFGDSAAFYDWVVDLAQPPMRLAVLDIGCGAGGALAALVRHNVRPVGLDVSARALERARAACPQASLVRGDGARLPFDDASFACIFNLGNLEHFVDVRGGIREMRRALTASGRAWILLPNLYYSGTLWRVIRTGYGPDHHQPIDRFATRSEWRDLLEVEGLEVVRSLPYHRGKWWKRILPSNLAWHFLYECKRGEPLEKRALDPLARSDRGHG